MRNTRNFAIFGLGAVFATAVSATDVPKPIPDNDTAVDSGLAISGISLPLSDVNVTFSITHPFDSDLDVYLIGPSGTKVLLVETLGDNPEVPSERLLPIAVLEQNAATLLVEQAVQPVNPLDGLVLVINTNQLSTMLFGAVTRQQPPQQRVA